MGGLGQNRQGRLRLHGLQQLLSPGVEAQHPQIGGRVRPVRPGQPQKGPHQQPPQPGLGPVPGLGQLEKLLQGPALLPGPLQAGGQALRRSAVRKGGPVPGGHSPQPGQQAPLHPPEAGHPTPTPPQDLRTTAREIGLCRPPVLRLQKSAELGGGEELRRRLSHQQAVVGGPLPADRHRADGTAHPVQGPEVLHPQVVVWRGQKR